MRLLIIRHAPAGDRDDFARSGLDDDLRPITDEGRRLGSGVAAGLTTLIPHIDRLVSSPLVRARQTADIVATGYGGIAIEESDVLRPATDPRDFRELVEDTGPEAVVAVVGHRPHLHRLAGWLLSGKDDEFIGIRKGAALCLKFPRRRGIRRGRGTLEWSLTPEQLVRLGRSVPLGDERI